MHIVVIVIGLLVACGAASSPTPSVTSPTVSPNKPPSPPPPEPEPDIAQTPPPPEPPKTKQDRDRCLELAELVARKEWQPARELAEELEMARQRDMTLPERSRCYHSIGQVHDNAGGSVRAAGALVNALELWPENYDALRDLLALSRRAPEAFDFKTVIRELRRVYRERGSKEGLALLPKG